MWKNIPFPKGDSSDDFLFNLEKAQDGTLDDKVMDAAHVGAYRLPPTPILYAANDPAQMIHAMAYNAPAFYGTPFINKCCKAASDRDAMTWMHKQYLAQQMHSPVNHLGISAAVNDLFWTNKHAPAAFHSGAINAGLTDLFEEECLATGFTVWLMLATLAPTNGKAAVPLSGLSAADLLQLTDNTLFFLSIYFADAGAYRSLMPAHSPFTRYSMLCTGTPAAPP